MESDLSKKLDIFDDSKQPHKMNSRKYNYYGSIYINIFWVSYGS